MENLVPLGTGNSRFMKSNISPDTTLAQLIQMLNNGTFPYDIGPINPAGISQQGTPLNQDTLLAALVAQKLGGVETPSEAFDLLRQIQFQGKYAFRVKVRYANGEPISGISIQGLLDFITGETAVTGDDGTVLGYTTSATASFSLKDYVDLTSTPVSAQGALGALVQAPDIIAAPVNFKRFDASETVQFSPAMTRLDVSIANGGGGGGSGGNGGIQSGISPTGGDGGASGSIAAGDGGSATLRTGGSGGGGGAGGGVLKQENVDFSPDVEYEAVVGSGGDGGMGVTFRNGDSNKAGNPGGAGGTSSFMGLTPTNGRSGSDGKDAVIGVTNGGSDGGDGGGSTSSAYRIYSSFTEEIQACVAGIGGNGGAFGERGTNGAIGQLGGGGGGGGGATYNNSGTTTRSGAGGRGGHGAIAIRMWHGEEAS